MSPRHRFGPHAIAAAILFLLGTLVGGPWLQAGGPSDREAGKHPRQVLIIRHAEKPEDDQDLHLNSRGAAGRRPAGAVPDPADLPDEPRPVHDAGFPRRHQGIDHQQPPGGDGDAAGQGAGRRSHPRQARRR